MSLIKKLDAIVQLAEGADGAIQKIIRLAKRPGGEAPAGCVLRQAKRIALQIRCAGYRGTGICP